MMHTTADYSIKIYTCWPKAFAHDGEAAIEEQTFADFLREHVEDPAKAWWVKEVDGRFEVRTNPHAQLRANALHGTFDTHAAGRTKGPWHPWQAPIRPLLQSDG